MSVQCVRVCFHLLHHNIITKVENRKQNKIKQRVCPSRACFFHLLHHNITHTEIDGADVPSHQVLLRKWPHLRLAHLLDLSPSVELLFVSQCRGVTGREEGGVSGHNTHHTKKTDTTHFSTHTADCGLKIRVYI